jgi:ferricrocin synthase
VLDFEKDVLLVHAIWIPSFITRETGAEVVDSFENAVIEFAEGSTGVDSIQEDGCPSPTVPLYIGIEEIPQLSTQEPDHDTLVRLQSLLSQFLGVSDDLLAEDASLAALGVDSIKSVGLSRILREEGYIIRPSDILKAPSVHDLALLVITDSRIDHSADQKGETYYSRSLSSLQSLFPSETKERLKLSENDSIKIFPVTALQAGMLTQVFLDFF